MSSVAPVSLWVEEEHSCEISEAPLVQGVAAVTLSSFQMKKRVQITVAVVAVAAPLCIYEVAELAVAAEDLRGYSYDGNAFMGGKHVVAGLMTIASAFALVANWDAIVTLEIVFAKLVGEATLAPGAVAETGAAAAGSHLC